MESLRWRSFTTGYKVAPFFASARWPVTGRIPAMAERVHVLHSALSMALLCGGLGAVL
jgi:hypothetical protein